MWPPSACPTANSSPQIEHPCTFEFTSSASLSPANFGFLWLAMWPPRAWKVANCRLHDLHSKTLPAATGGGACFYKYFSGEYFLSSPSSVRRMSALAISRSVASWSSWGRFIMPTMCLSCCSGEKVVVIAKTRLRGVLFIRRWIWTAVTATNLSAAASEIYDLYTDDYHLTYQHSYLLSWQGWSTNRNRAQREAS